MNTAQHETCGRCGGASNTAVGAHWCVPKEMEYERESDRPHPS